MDLPLQLLVLLEIVLLVLQITDGVGSLTVEIIDPACCYNDKKRSLIIQYPAVFDALVPRVIMFLKVTDANRFNKTANWVVDVTDRHCRAIQNEILYC
jgi:hypothetical protein